MHDTFVSAQSSNTSLEITCSLQLLAKKTKKSPGNEQMDKDGRNKGKDGTACDSPRPSEGPVRLKEIMIIL